MMNVPRLDEQHTLPLFLNDNQPVIFDSLENAVETIEQLKNWHPEIEFEVRQYFRKSTYAFELMQYGTWIIGNAAVTKR